MQIKLITAWVFCALALLASSVISAPLSAEEDTEVTSEAPEAEGAEHDEESGDED